MSAGMNAAVPRGSRIRAFAARIAAAERRRLVRFGLSGVASTGVHVAVAGALFAYVDASAVTANAVAFVCATLASYLLNTLWSFSAPPSRRNAFRFLVASSSGLVATMLIAHAVQATGMARGWSIVAVLFIVPPLTYAVHRGWTYRVR